MHGILIKPHCLGGKGESELFAAWLSNDDLLLVHGVGGVLELGHVEALGLDLVLKLYDRIIFLSKAFVQERPRFLF